MAGNFDPKRVLRQISNNLLNDLFMSHGHETEIPWDDLTETEIEPVFFYWQEMDESERREIEIVLHEVNDMATGDEGIRAIIEEAVRQGNQTLIDELDDFESRYDKAVWTYLRATDLWNLAVRFARADSMSRGRYWIKRCDIPNLPPETSSDRIAELEQAFAAFFVASQARGRHCQIEPYTRASGSHYFFAYLDDYADTYVTLDDAGEFDRRPERRAFELVLVYDQENGSLEMFVRGGKRVYIPIQEIFCRVILGIEIGPENRNSHPYELNGLIRRDFQFATDPVDGILSVRVRKLRLNVKGSPGRRITLEANSDGNPDDIYEMLDRYLNQQRLPLSILDVTQVGFKFSFDQELDNLPKSLSFELSSPNSSNLKSKPEAARELAEKYLRLWGVDRVQTTQHT